MHNFQNFIVWLFLHRDDDFVPSRVERDLQIFIEVQNRFVGVADFETLVDHPYDLPYLEKPFPLCADSSSVKTIIF